MVDVTNPLAVAAVTLDPAADASLCGAYACCTKAQSQQVLKAAGADNPTITQCIADPDLLWFP